MVLALQRTFSPRHDQWITPAPTETDAGLQVEVIFTTMEATLSALKKAASLANQLSARINLLVPQVVPYPLPLMSPPVLLDWTERRFRVLAEHYAADTTVQIYLCRDRMEALLAVLRPQSIVVLGMRRKWWPAFESKLQRRLRRAGHEVIVTKPE